MVASGLIAFPITPMDDDGRVNEAGLRRLVRRCADGGADAVCVLGSTGTYAFLARDERRRAVEAAAEELNGAMPLHAGVGALRTDDAIRHAQDARAAGAAVGLLAAMSYTPLTEVEVEAHFRAVAQEGGLPICLYDNPAATHFTMSDGLVERLSRAPGIVAIKSPSPAASQARERLGALRAIVPKGFSVGFSGDPTAAATLIAGADAWYSVLAGLFPAPVAGLRRAVADGELDEAHRLDAALQPMWALMREYSGLRVMYAAAEHAGLCSTRPPRPILPLADHVKRRVADTIDSLGDLLN